MNLKMSSGKCSPFCSSQKVLITKSTLDIPPPALCAAHTGYIIQASDWLKANLTIKSGLPLINLKLK